MAETEIVKKLIDINGEQCVSESEAMNRHTTFRIGDRKSTRLNSSHT